MGTDIIITAGQLAAIVGFTAILSGLVSGLLVNWVNERHFADERRRAQQNSRRRAGMASEARGIIEGRS